MEHLGTLFFALAVLHTFSVKWFQHLSSKSKEESLQKYIFHFLGEVEIAFGLWTGVLILFLSVLEGPLSAIEFIEKADFTEALFVFAVLTVVTTKPILGLAHQLISGFSKVLPLPKEASFYFSALFLGPLLGSLITEPAAMAVTATLLKVRFYEKVRSERFQYLTLGTLFVNVSIGGVLTHFAAPPVLMVAKTWAWDTPFVFSHLGWKAIIAIFINTSFALWICLKDLGLAQALPQPLAQALTQEANPSSDIHAQAVRTPGLLTVIHVAVLGLVVMTSHHPQVFIGILLFFFGILEVTRKYQDDSNIRQNLLVAFFLAGLVALGGLQTWWLEPLLKNLNSVSLFLGASGLTSFTDNAALTYLGSQIAGITEEQKYALVAGAISAGGLTVIANAPNPAGFAILRDSFGEEGISSARLFKGAIIPTLIAMTCLWFL